MNHGHPDLDKRVVGLRRQARMQAPADTAQQSPDRNAPRARCILLGASNLTRGIASAVHAALTTTVQPVQFLVAAGHGRSYGAYSRVLGRGLPGILQSALWQALADSPKRLPTRALITDIGNDIAYGQSSEKILAWLKQCLEQLLAYDAQVTMTELPLASLEGLTPRRYLIYRTLLFPSNRQSLAATLEQARTLNLGLHALARSFAFTLLRQPAEWFGHDPVHIARHRLPEAYRTMLAPRKVDSNDAHPVDELPWSLRVRLQVAPPACQDLGHWRRLQQQPCLTLADNSTLAFY